MVPLVVPLVKLLAGAAAYLAVEKAATKAIDWWQSDSRTGIGPWAANHTPPASLELYQKPVGEVLGTAAQRRNRALLASALGLGAAAFVVTRMNRSRS